MSKRWNLFRPTRWPVLLLTLCVTSMTAMAQDCEVKIGVTGPMSGGASSWGLATKAGAEFEAAMTNAAGGLRVGDHKCKVTVVSFDAQYTAAGGAAASSYFASQNIHAIIGPVGSPETTGFKPVAKRDGQVNFSSASATDAIGPEWPLSFHQLQSPHTSGPVLIKEAKNRFKFQSVVVIAANDQGGTTAGQALAKIYADQGVKATQEYYQRGTTNFAPLATRIMNENPDTVELAATPPGDAALLVKQLLQAGYTGVFGGLGGIGVNPVVQGAGGIDKLKGYYWLQLMPVEDPGAQRLRVDYERVMNSSPPQNDLLYTSTTATEQLLRAISAAGTDQDADKIAAALRKMTPESRYFGKGGWRGQSQYGINQELAFPVGLGIIADGKRVGVQRIEIPAE